MRMKRTCIPVAGLLLLAAPSLAQDDVAAYRVGRTGIMCVKAPCPSAGIMAEPAPNRPPPATDFTRPIYWGDSLPRIEASPADRAHIEQAWPAGCVRVEGRFRADAPQGPLLTVSRMLGDCTAHSRGQR